MWGWPFWCRGRYGHVATRLRTLHDAMGHPVHIFEAIVRLLAYAKLCNRLARDVLDGAH